MKTVNFTIIGDGYVGKTSMLYRYTEDRLPCEYVPTVFENYSGTITVDGAKYTLLLRDTSGQEDYERIRRLSYFNVDCFLICFAVNSASSLANIKCIWVPEITKASKKSKFILVGTKLDLRLSDSEDCVEECEAVKMMKSIKADGYIECSSVTKEGIHEVFELAIRTLFKADKKRRCTLL